MYVYFYFFYYWEEPFKRIIFETNFLPAKAKRAKILPASSEKNVEIKNSSQEHFFEWVPPEIHVGSVIVTRPGDICSQHALFEARRLASLAAVIGRYPDFPVG